jgi:hypothetical protein
MAELFRDPMYVFPVDTPEGRARDATDSRTVTPGRSSLTEVFDGPGTPSLRTAEFNVASPSLLYEATMAERTASRSPRGEVISVMTREGDEVHYPVVQGRAGGSIHGQSCVPGLMMSNAAVRADVATRAHRHASLLSAPVSSNSATAGDQEEEEAPAEAAETYQHSRTTPSSIQRHRRSSRNCSRSPPPSVALRGEPVEDTVRATGSQLPSVCSSLANTPRQSIRRTPASSPLHELSVLDGVALERRTRAAMDGAAMRMEEIGVSTPEMAEYFADSAMDAQMRSSSSANFGGNVCGSSSSSLPSRRNFVTPRHSQQYGASVLQHHPQQAEGGAGGSSGGGGSNTGPSAAAAAAAPATGRRANHFKLDRLMFLMEEQSRMSQQLLQRMDTLEEANKTLMERLSMLETAMEASRKSEEAITRVSAESASPSVTRTSGSVDSGVRPSTRAPSKAVN